jgi:hypothetical protein
LAKEKNCASLFASTSKANEHAKIMHRSLPYPCPFAVEMNCTKAFQHPQNAKTHGNLVHLRSGYCPCPFAEVYLYLALITTPSEGICRLDAKRLPQISLHFLTSDSTAANCLHLPRFQPSKLYWLSIVAEQSDVDGRA